jgi:hypothetical protein
MFSKLSNWYASWPKLLRFTIQTILFPFFAICAVPFFIVIGILQGILEMYDDFK